MASLVLTIKETLRYRGAIGQWSWVLHRLTGLGVVLFLFLHVVDTSWAVTDPAAYVKAIAAYQSPLFTIGEFGLLFAVVYHALNGLRIAVMDFRPDLWKYQQKAAWWVLGATAVILVPVFIGMISHVLDFYSHDPEVLPLGEVLAEQIIFVFYFIGGMVLAGTIAFLISAVRINVDSPEDGKVKIRQKGATERRVEKFWWSFMRISGVLIIPLVFGHLAMMHVLQGVFDITAVDYSVVGVPVTRINATEAQDAFNAGELTVFLADTEVETQDGIEQRTIIVPDGINQSGTAVEFVAERWEFMFAGIQLWKIYDIALLFLVVMHGFNGLRLVLTDYTMDNVLARRTVVWLTIIGGLALLWFGSQALWLSVDNEAITMALEASRALH